MEPGVSPELPALRRMQSKRGPECRQPCGQRQTSHACINSARKPSVTDWEQVSAAFDCSPEAAELENALISTAKHHVAQSKKQRCSTRSFQNDNSSHAWRSCGNEVVPKSTCLDWATPEHDRNQDISDIHVANSSVEQLTKDTSPKQACSNQTQPLEPERSAGHLTRSVNTQSDSMASILGNSETNVTDDVANLARSLLVGQAANNRGTTGCRPLEAPQRTPTSNQAELLTESSRGLQFWPAAQLSSARAGCGDVCFGGRAQSGCAQPRTTDHVHKPCTKQQSLGQIHISKKSMTRLLTDANTTVMKGVSGPARSQAFASSQPASQILNVELHQVSSTAPAYEPATQNRMKIPDASACGNLRGVSESASLHQLGSEQRTAAGNGMPEKAHVAIVPEGGRETLHTSVSSQRKPSAASKRKPIRPWMKRQRVEG